MAVAFGVILVVAGCGPQPKAEVTTLLSAERCGLFAAKQPGASKEMRDFPPACDLPKAEELAQSCAIHDQVTAPDYNPKYDDEGNILNFVPPPTYGVSDMLCRFTDKDRNRAICNFGLTLPGKAPVPAKVTLRHEYWADHGPAHHFEGTMWNIAKSCQPGAKR